MTRRELLGTLLGLAAFPANPAGSILGPVPEGKSPLRLVRRLIFSAGASPCNVQFFDSGGLCTTTFMLMAHEQFLISGPLYVTPDCGFSTTAPCKCRIEFESDPAGFEGGWQEIVIGAESGGQWPA